MRNLPAILALAALATLSRGRSARGEGPVPTDAVDVRKDTTWSGEVRLARRIEVAREATLRIEPGTRITIPWVDVKGAEPGEKPGIEVFGRLVADGDAKTPIRFEPEPKPKDARPVKWPRWRGILVHAAAPAFARLVRCLIVGAETGFQPGGTTSVARDCVFFGCATGVGTGVLWANATQAIEMLGDVAPTIDGCRFGDCVVGIAVEADARPYVHRCVFFGCGAGIANDRPGTSYPVSGLGAFVDRSEFLRCKLAVGGPARVTNCLFEANRLVFAGSEFGELYVTSIDPFVAGRNLYFANEALVRSDVPVGADAIVADPKRRGGTPPKLSGDELLEPLGDVLGLAPDSPGRGTAGDGGDLGAFGADGTVRADPAASSRGPGLAIEDWLQLGPREPDPATLPGLAKGVTTRPRLAGDVDGGTQWAALEGGLLADPDGSRKLLAELPAARTLLATLSSEQEGNVSLRLAWDGTLVGWWNGEPLALPEGPRRFRPDDARVTVVRRKGPNTLLVRHAPRMTTGRLAVRVVDAFGDVAPDGLGPAPSSPPAKPAGSTPIVSASWSIAKGPDGKPSGRGMLKLALSNLVHWRDAANLRHYGLVDAGGKAVDLTGVDVNYQPKERTVVMTFPRLLASGAWKVRAAHWRRADGEPFPTDPAEVTFRVP